MVSVEQANEIVAKLRELESEQRSHDGSGSDVQLKLPSSGTTHDRDVQR